jgi:hypothetical protein
LLSGCGGSGGGPVTRDTTVMVYIVGSDLVGTVTTKGAAANIAEMMQVGSTASMNVVIQTGGSGLVPATEPANPNAMQPGEIDWRRVQRYQVNAGSLQRVADLGAEVKSPANPAVDMGNAETLQAFLAWGAKDYPAKKYIVVLWDHGGGVNGGFGTDDVTGSRLSVADISQTMKAAASAGMSLEIVGFDACLMATAEVAASLNPAASYLVASQDIEDSLSWAYVPFLTYVTKNPGLGGKEIGTEIVDSYVAKLKAAGFDAVTLSVTDLSKAKALSDATDGFATALRSYTQSPSGWKQIAQARVQSIDWATSAMFLQDHYDLVDMQTFVFKVVDGINKSIAPDETLTVAGINLGSALDAAIVYNVATGSNRGATGLSLYFPSIAWAYPGNGYPAKTTAGGTSYFAPLYAGASGLVKAYYDYYEAHAVTLEATVTSTPTPADPLLAEINNDFAYVLAAHQTSGCTLYGANRAVITPAPSCFRGMQMVESFSQTQASKWAVTFAGTTGWPHLEDGTGSFPVPLLPDQFAAARLGNFNAYLIPVYLKQTPPMADLAGYLVVEEVYPLTPGPISLKVAGFQSDATMPGKTYLLENGEVYALGAYTLIDPADPSLGSVFRQSDKEVTVKGGTLSIVSRPLSGGNFGYFVNDLTGKIQASVPVAYR